MSTLRKVDSALNCLKKLFPLNFEGAFKKSSFQFLRAVRLSKSDSQTFLPSVSIIYSIDLVKYLNSEWLIVEGIKAKRYWVCEELKVELSEKSLP